MILTKQNDLFRIDATDYSAEISREMINIYICGESVARLVPRTALDVTNDDNETWETDVDSEDISFEKTCDDPATFVWKTKSSLWREKTYNVICYNNRLEYFVTVNGSGRVDSVKYFMYNNKKLGSEIREISGQNEFYEGFFPNIFENGNDGTYPTDSPYTSLSLLTVPPMFVHSYKTVGISKILSFGVVAELGEHNFNRFNYYPKMYFMTNQDGHVYVDGTWTSPKIVIQPADNYYNAIEKYSNYYFESGICKRSAKKLLPRFWHGPIACGWHEQIACINDERGIFDCCCEDVYTNMLAKHNSRGIYPKILIIDDKWMKEYGPAIVDEKKWPDLRGYIDSNRKNGVHTFLWFKLWDSEGTPEDFTLWDPAEKQRINDPTNPGFREMLREILHRLLSSDEGCYNADGLKVDFGFMQPHGRKAIAYDKTKYGAELMYEYLKLIHDVMKEVKPHAVMNASPCHPIFDPIIDHARLHDYESPRRNLEEFTHRAKVWGTALPSALIDTDSGWHSTNRDVVRFLLGQADIGIPDLYYASDFNHLKLTDEEWSRVAESWQKYNNKMDILYGEDEYI